MIVQTLLDRLKCFDIEFWLFLCMISTKQTVYTPNQTAWGLYGVGGDVDEVDNWHSLKGLRLHELKGLELDSTLGGIGDSSNQGFKPTSGQMAI